ncbi:UDP-glucose 4-epimerase GalE [Xanthomonas hortorum]|uniref:UDP-glucose 4-epimerase n=1 Tax=Xanthomonas hortorum pv. pelargonii TaxID=453602 RepID=A0A6V7EQF8_9XANT|nr:UDP-glucose 4-epimerase GalE [Xanthomonas hortorum]MCE4352433.1 UDP-glucose 4-epimerase GalE [Xanthomonas hortorum pv. pelargonii]MCM5525652.1 UDP-glucose 4-epimerase GalE [Xanthomonas hortorum pv. pelargonii]MCM5535800.1 UDP-glucose 4-epimerase GalE [Xanthomonas hortorum pv. pelargonii]MCM5539926.1 UDP-glucose 4-epimerase GalE [Xanthomonas hortorum pv. pelargonii]MCM5546759.1 UDP-glucose 4-epimerase GalE [Xanthomonas hortorum pv. pelargonii]
MRILVTGGTGYIGSHTCVELARRGHDVCIIDNLSNSSERVLDHLQYLMGARPEFHRMDVRAPELAELLSSKRIDAVLHFAALKAVGESVREPLLYFNNNVTGTLALLRAMRTAEVSNLVFSSSATVYGDENISPIEESAPLKAINPYGRTKLMMEEMIGDLSIAWPEFNAALLRYFNPVGAHPSGYLGEDPRDVPNNLMPYIAQVAVGRRAALQVFGDDYPTADGTGVRDYLHVMDLARAHVDAIDYLQRERKGLVVNLGSGRGHSVREVAAAFERASGCRIPLSIAPRRDGDVAVYYANATLANRLLGWKAEYDLDRMCRDTWRWQQLHPDGYATSRLTRLRTPNTVPERELVTPSRRLLPTAEGRRRNEVARTLLPADRLSRA